MPISLTLAFEGLKIGKQSAGGDEVSRDAKRYFGESAWNERQLERLIMSEFNPPIESKSSERSNSASDDNLDNEADLKTVYELSWQLNRSNAAKISTDQSPQQSSIRDLLAYDNDRYNQRAKALLLTQDLTQQEGELPPGTFAPQNPILEEVLTPAVNPVRQAAEDLELLTQILCDRISLRLNLEMERNGFHQSNRIFSRQTIPVQSSSKSEHAPDVIEQLAQEIEQLLHQRLVHERERRGRFVGCLPW
ncbi:MAG: hypothetical protein V7L05_08970 [Nostoc sp.]|uniref:hypothetical protein n=1 Tax=Nostoc sp. TaxID=1180 RepID=UPI002FF93551